MAFVVVLSSMVSYMLPSSAVHHQRRQLTSAVMLDQEQETAFEAMGYSVGTNMLGELKVLDADEVDALLTGVRASLLGEEPPAPLSIYVPKANELMQEKMVAKASAAIAEGEMAIEAAAAETDAVKTDSGLVYLSITEGTGESPSAADTVNVHYEGKLIDGTVFDSSYARGEPISFGLSQVYRSRGADVAATDLAPAVARHVRARHIQVQRTGLP